jgi:hypothetical protein
MHFFIRRTQQTPGGKRGRRRPALHADGPPAATQLSLLLLFPISLLSIPHERTWRGTAEPPASSRPPPRAGVLRHHLASPEPPGAGPLRHHLASPGAGLLRHCLARIPAAMTHHHLASPGVARSWERSQGVGAPRWPDTELPPMTALLPPRGLVVAATSTSLRPWRSISGAISFGIGRRHTRGGRSVAWQWREVGRRMLEVGRVALEVEVGPTALVVGVDFWCVFLWDWGAGWLASPPHTKICASSPHTGQKMPLPALVWGDGWRCSKHCCSICALLLATVTTYHSHCSSLLASFLHYGSVEAGCGRRMCGECIP